jgi:TonB family protein
VEIGDPPPLEVCMTRRTFPLVAVLGAALVLPTAAAQSIAPVQPPARTVQDDAWPPPGVSRMKDQGVHPPAVVTERRPGYTAEAMRAQIQGVVEVQAIVQADGRVGEVRVLRSLDKEFGLDDQAVTAVKAWIFKPGRKDGEAVPVLVNIELTFSIRKR